VTNWVFPAGAAAVDGGDDRLPPWMVFSSALGEEWLYCYKWSRLATEEEWRVEEKCLCQFSPVYFFGTTALAHLPSSLLRHVDFAVFHPYGFAIWD
jgi:hypothetical protein